MHHHHHHLLIAISSTLLSHWIRYLRGSLPSSPFLVYTLILFRILLSDSTSPVPLCPCISFPFFNKLGMFYYCYCCLVAALAGATDRLLALKYGYSCFSNTKTNAILSSLPSYSTGVSLLYHYYYCCCCYTNHYNLTFYQDWDACPYLTKEYLELMSEYHLRNQSIKELLSYTFPLTNSISLTFPCSHSAITHIHFEW